MPRVAAAPSLRPAGIFQADRTQPSALLVPALAFLDVEEQVDRAIQQARRGPAGRGRRWL